MREPMSYHEYPEWTEQDHKNVYYGCDPAEEYVSEFLTFRIIGQAAPHRHIHETDVQKEAAGDDADEARNEAQSLGGFLYAGKHDETYPDESERIQDSRIDRLHARKPAQECRKTAEVDDVRIPFKKHEYREASDKQTDACSFRSAYDEQYVACHIDEEHYPEENLD